MGVIDEVIEEPLGGAHRNKEQIVSLVKNSIKKYLEEFLGYEKEKIFEQRKNKFLEIGKQSSFTEFLKFEGSLIKKDNLKYKITFLILILLAIVVFFFK